MQYSSFLKFKIFWNSRTHWRVSSKRSWNLRLTHPEGSLSYIIVTLTSLFRRRQWHPSSTLAWKIPGSPQSMESLRVGHDWATSLSLFSFHALKKEMATHSSVLAWRIPGTTEPGGLQSMGSHRVGHDWSDLAAAAAVKILHWSKVHLGFPKTANGKTQMNSVANPIV